MPSPLRALPRLHLLTNDAILARDDFSAQAATLFERGGPRVALHLRGPTTSGRRLWELGRALLDPARASDSALVVNDRVDLALALAATAGESGAAVRGVHLGARSLPTEVVRGLVGSGFVIGRSVHGLDELHAASPLDALDYLMVGTLFPTPSHPGREGSGTDGLERIAGRTSLSLVGVGGITVPLAAKLRSDVAGVAVIRGVWDAPDPPAAVEAYLDALDAPEAEDALDAEERMMKLIVNGSERSVPEGMTVTGLLETLELTPETVVVERNREIVPRSEYERVRLDEGDRLELVHFVGGG